MKVVTLAVGWLVLSLSAAAAGQPAVASADASSAAWAVRFLDRPVEALTAYRAVRHLEATNTRFDKHGWMDVLTVLSPESGFTVEVLAEGGSGYIRSKVLRPILDGEREIVARGDIARSALTTRNYEITDQQPAGPGLIRLTVKPLRREVTLIDGAVIVTEADADLVRVEGRLARNPSFWTRRVDVLRRYGRIAGIRVPLSIESTAQIRIAGPSTMTMTYQYESVNGRNVMEHEMVDAR